MNTNFSSHIYTSIERAFDTYIHLTILQYYCGREQKYFFCYTDYIYVTVISLNES